MGDRHLQLRRPASIEKIAVPDKKALLYVGAPSPQQQHAAASWHEAPAVSVLATPRTAAAAGKQNNNNLPGSPRACLCSPTLHAGSFRCRLHRGTGGGGSVGSGLHEKSKKPGGV